MINKIAKLSAIIVLITVFVILLTSIIIFQTPIFKIFNFNNSDKLTVSTVFNSVLTPIVSLISVILLYITLLKQNESINDQKQGRNVELILMMFNQLVLEYSNYEVEDYHRGNIKIFKGSDAFIRTIFLINKDSEMFINSERFSKISGIISSYILVQDLLYSLNIDSESKHAINYKMANFYEVNLRTPLIIYATLLKNEVRDDIVMFIRDVISFEKGRGSEFDPNTFVIDPKYSNIQDF
ncbi:hypothetical protein J5U18_12765 [Sphingobacteriaceae bacterium WQ 2009]|uniref:Phage abortive infection protein n=1 Tax=Rhinopithecimicrobium faecis TaxID=2820698 RepID=A0A8T4HD70_9SPHI|nr:hypothetical protein [Sphingobacteriaceae bacterium WQ 2009]